MATCSYDCGWGGRCRSEAGEGGVCDKHRGLKCASCGETAVRECDHTGIQFVCGAPLCADCEHGAPDRDNPGWFNLGGGHVTKVVARRQFEAMWARNEGRPTDPSA